MMMIAELAMVETMGYLLKAAEELGRARVLIRFDVRQCSETRIRYDRKRRHRDLAME